MNRWIIAAIVIIACLLALALFGYLSGNWDEDEAARPGYGLASFESRAEERPLCMDEATRERIKSAMMEALDDALKEHIKHVFEVWLKDERGQPGRARTGVQLGIRAYLGARQGALEWAPPACSG